MTRVRRRDAAVEPSRELLDARRFAEKYPDGVMGLEPSSGTAELGKKLLQRSVDICVDEIEKW
jgi:creatinine amidohydrolase/Fe(II)-dependent formamide hydrolase-like protein